MTETTTVSTVDEIARAIGDPGSVLPRLEGESVTRWSARAVEQLLNPPCVMTHTPPMDFAQCETHDTTFALGETCKFDGREPWLVFADEADEQRRRAVVAELEVEQMHEWQDELAEKMPPEFDGDEAQEYLIDHWVTTMTTQLAEAKAEVARLLRGGHERLNDKQRATLDRMEAEVKTRWALHASTMNYAFDEPARHGRDTTVRVMWGDGERIAEATINRHGHGGYWISDLDLLHNDHDDECDCKHCRAYRDEEDV